MTGLVALDMCLVWIESHTTVARKWLSYTQTVNGEHPRTPLLEIQPLVGVRRGLATASITE
jgi:hypothetical protein